MAKITYENKTALNINPEIDDINKVTHNDMNEIKNVVNENYDETRGTILYENETGTYTSATLNDNISNYSKIVIIWEPNWYIEFLGRRTTTDYDFKPNKKYMMFTSFWSNTNNQIYTNVTGYSITGRTLTISENQGGTVGQNTSYTTHSDIWKIVKIIGYK